MAAMSTESTTAASAGPSAAAPRELTLRRLLTPSLFINAVAPAVIYQILTSRGLTSFNALVLVALFPIVGIAISLLRTHRVDAVGILSLAFITVGLVTSLLSGDERFLLLKESLITGAFGLVCLGSLLLPRPLMFYFGRSFSAGDPAAVQRYDSLWAYPRFRHIQRTLTVGWGCGYVAEACLRVVLLAVLPITLFLAISQFLALGVTVLLLLWTVRYVRAARAQATAFGVQTP
jgi:intracellular septation protein A